MLGVINMKIKYKFKGQKKIINNIYKIQTSMFNDLARFLYEEGLKIEAESTRRIPVDTGFARSHKYTSPAIKHHNNLIVEIGYLDAVDYIVPLHERTDVRHVVGEAKFLENAFVKHEADFEKNLAAFIKMQLSRYRT